MSSIVWFRRDLRLRDNAAFHKALTCGEPILPVYVFAPEEEAPWQPGGASRWYLHQSLEKLKRALADLGLELELRRGVTAEILKALADQTGANRVLCNTVYEPALLRQQKEVADALQGGVGLTAFHDHALLEPGTIKNGSGKPYRVFTPFWKRLSEHLFQMPGDQGLLPLPGEASPSAVKAGQTRLDDLDLLDAHPWHEKLTTHWEAGEQAALEKLDAFVEERMEGYPDGRDFPAEDWNSRLSASLHFGEISPWRILDTLRPAYLGEWGEKAAVAGEAFLRQLGWRDFAIQLLHDHPDSPNKSLQDGYDDSGVWFEDEGYRQRWMAGKTGVPLVDAGMAELWETGVMHNRVRMVAASLLTKNLGQHWTVGARWFWDTLVDADLANNTMGWQWVAGCGVDAAPYYRIFNPQTQAERFDRQGRYINRWTDSESLSSAIVDLKVSRQQALDRHKEMKS